MVRLPPDLPLTLPHSTRPFTTQETMLTTASSDYDESYPSHAHGWSSGPTSALTNAILGLDVTGPAGSNWTLSPQPGDLTHMQGGFTTPLGKFSAKYATSVTKAGQTKIKVTWSVPEGTMGVVTLPVNSTGSVAGNVDFTGWSLNASAVGGDGEVLTTAGQPAGTTIMTTVFGEVLASFGVGGGEGSVSYTV